MHWCSTDRRRSSRRLSSKSASTRDVSAASGDVLFGGREHNAESTTSRPKHSQHRASQHGECLAVADVPNVPTGSRFLLMKFPRDKNTALLRLRALRLMPCSARAPAAFCPSAASRFGPAFRGFRGFYGLTPHMISTHALAGRRIIAIQTLSLVLGITAVAKRGHSPVSSRFQSSSHLASNTHFA